MDWRGLAGDLGIIAGILVSVGIFLLAGKKTWWFFRRVGEVFDLLLGDPFARPPKLSVMEHVMEIHKAQMEDRVEFREHLAELHRQASGQNVRPIRRGGTGPTKQETGS